MENKNLIRSIVPFSLCALSLLSILILFILSGCVGPVIKMPKPLPDIVKDYKSVAVSAGIAGMKDTGLHVNQGDYLTILAKGSIDVWPPKGRFISPPGNLLYRIGAKGYASRYYFYDTIRIRETGNLYLGYVGGSVDSYGEALNPNYYADDKGYFIVDLIVWKKDDPVLMADLMEEASRNDPQNEVLKQFARSLQRQKEFFLAEQKASREAAQAQDAIKALETKGPDPMKERQIAELKAKLQDALQALKELEEMKKKIAEREQKEEEMMARLRKMEEERMKSAKNLPFIAILNPADKAVVESEYVYLSGVAGDDQGLTKMEIKVNGKVIKREDERGLRLVAKDAKRIEFSERIRLQEGKNEISVTAQNREGLTAGKTVSIHLARKPGEVWAAVIGINKYRHLPSLKYSVNDAREFYRYLVEVNQVPRENIWLLLDEEATLEKIRSVLGTQIRQKAGKNDMVIIYLAGHGATERDSSSLDGDGLEKYILPHNADPKDLYASALPMNEIARIFQRISSERLVFVSDTCYSGASGGRTVPILGMRANISSAFLDRLSQGKGRVIITASDANEISVEKDELRHGVFTYYLLEALRGKGDLDGNGVITVDEVYRYVSMKVPEATAQEQHPVKKGEVKGEIVLGVRR